MAAPDAAAVAAQGAAADLAVGDIALTGSTALSEPTLLDMVLCDHRNLSALFSHFEAAAQQQAQHRMQMHAAAIVQEVRMHSQAEDAVLYPLLESLANGSTDNAVAAVTSREAHRRVDQDMLGVLAAVGCTLGGPLPPGTSPPDLAEAMRRLQADLIAHMLEEERMVLPRLAAAYSRDALVIHGKDFVAQKLQTSFGPYLSPQPAAIVPTSAAAPDGILGSTMPPNPVPAVLAEGKPVAADGGAGRARGDTAGEEAMVE